MQIRGFRGERWWVWVGMAVLLSGIILLNLATALLNRIMPRKHSPLEVAALTLPELTCSMMALLEAAVRMRVGIAAEADAWKDAECIMAEATAL